MTGWNLKHELAQRLLREMLTKGRGNSAGVVLVVDPHTSKILSSCLRMHDLLSNGVLVLQNLTLQREKLRDLPAIYFIEPTQEAFDMIISDFPLPPPPPPVPEKSRFERALAALHLSSTPKETQQVIPPKFQPHYATAHLFFTTPVPAEQMKQLQEASVDMKRIKSFVELNIDFVAFESRVFHFDQPHWIRQLYMGEAAEDGPSNVVLKPLVQQISSVLACVMQKNELPYIRYISDKLNIGKTFISKQLADLLDKALMKQWNAANAAIAASSSSSTAAASNSSHTAAGSSTAAIPASSSSPPTPFRNTTILIVDRSLDPLTPLMHEFTFQAMVNDLLKVTGSEIAHLSKPEEKGKGSGDTLSNSTLSQTSKEELAKQLALAKSGKKDVGANVDDEKDENEVVLSEDDPLWIEYRHRHIGEVMVGVNRKLKDFSQSNKMAQYQHLQHSLLEQKKNGEKGGSGTAGTSDPSESKKDSVKDVLRAVQEMPEYKAAMRGFTKHVNLAQECLEKFKSKSLQQVGELEQCLATNTDIEGHVYQDNKILKERLKKMINGDKLAQNEKPISVLDKLRLCAIYAIVQGGIPDPLLKVLSSSIHPSLLKKIIGRNLEDFGVDIDSHELQLSRHRIQELQERNSSQTLALMRYTPSLQSILESLVENSLPTKQFPYTKSAQRKTKEEEEEEQLALQQAQQQAHKNSKKLGSSSHSSASSTEKSAEQARAKLLLDAEKDLAHKPIGKSARRRTGEKKDLEGATVNKKDPNSFDGGDGDINSSGGSSMDKSHKLTPSSSMNQGSGSSSSSFQSQGSIPHRYIVFMLGGLCFSEMRACYTVSEATGQEILIGSTAPLTPAEFLLDLSGLTRKQFHEKLAASVSTSTSATASSGTPSAAAQSAAKLDAGSNLLLHTPAASGTEPGITKTRKKPTKEPDAQSSSTDTGSSSSEDDPPAKAPASTKSAAAKVPTAAGKKDASASSSSATPSSKPAKKSLITEKELIFASEEEAEEEITFPPPDPRVKKSAAKK